MAFALPLDEIRKLSAAERIRLLDEIWETLEDDQQAIPVTPEQAEELDRRLEDYARDGDPGTPWEEVKARWRAAP